MYCIVVEEDSYDARDVKKVKENMNYVMKFVKHKLGNESDSIEMMVQHNYFVYVIVVIS